MATYRGIEYAAYEVRTPIFMLDAFKRFVLLYDHLA
jgi:hypothetical protein